MNESGKIDILLVDDKAENLLALEVVLDHPEYNLIKANSGKEALRYLLDNDCALILMDVQMPEMDGFETASYIKGSERSHDIPIIFITAINFDERFVSLGYRRGAVDYLLKPFDPKILSSKVAVFADLYRARREIKRQAELLRKRDRIERERALAQLELKSLKREQIAKERYRDLVEGLQTGVIWTADPITLAFTFVSPSAEMILGLQQDRWRNETDFLENRLHPIDRERVLKTARNLKAGEKSSTLEHRLVKSDGTIVWVQTGMRLGKKIDSDSYELRGLSIDVTRLKQTEAAIKRNEEHARFMSDASLILSQSLETKTILSEIGRIAVPRLADWFTIDLLQLDGTVETVSIVQIDPDKAALGHEIRHKYPPRLSDAVGAGKVMAGGGSEFIQDVDEEILSKLAKNEEHLSLLKKLGATSAIVVPMMSFGRILGAVTLVCAESKRRYDVQDLATAEDLARRMALALENARLFREAQAAIQSRDEFISIASHELKTPLTPLKLQIQMLSRTLEKENLSAPISQKFSKMIQSSDRQLSRLARLVEDLLDISRINIRKLDLNFESFDLFEVVEEVAERFSDQLRIAQCQLSLNRSGMTAGRWDRFRIEQVIVNLLTNAIKYGANRPIEFNLQGHASGIIMSVRDQGIGIHENDQVRVFERFERAVSSGHFGGLGLGLYIVKEILAAHQGKIWIQSDLGKGSVFFVSIPLNSEELYVSPDLNYSTYKEPTAGF